LGFCPKRWNTQDQKPRSDFAITNERAECYSVRKKQIKKEEERAALGVREIESRISFGDGAERRKTDAVIALTSPSPSLLMPRRREGNGDRGVPLPRSFSLGQR